ncbi:MAG: MBL fold metallo-hydrolase [Lachnospiraceae bacterium]|nr:MBL fold metallo-hydrolase [Lachnospiraceae bacterium]
MRNMLRKCLWLVLTVFLCITVSASQPFELHLLDVGQGQSVLIVADNHYMLIDGGGRDSSSFVVSYLKQLGLDYLDYIAVSHYDEDHMSGLIGVMSVFETEGILVPPYAGEGELYESFAAAAVSNGGMIFHPECGWSFQLGDAVVEVIGPQSKDYDNDNEESLVFRITYGDTSCLITGDAEQHSEIDMINSGYDLSADIYVAGHHGSSTSSTDIFLDTVAPSYGLISCGKGNSYGHPAMETMQRFQQRGITMFRTDLQGTVIAYSDGYIIWFNVDSCNDWTPGSNMETDITTRTFPVSEEPVTQSGDYNQEISYVCNTNSKKFHRPECPSVNDIKPENRMDTQMNREDLIAQGYQPCKRCNP